MQQQVMSILAFWIVMLTGLLIIIISETYCLHLKGLGSPCHSV